MYNIQSILTFTFAKLNGDGQQKTLFWGKKNKQTVSKSNDRPAQLRAENVMNEQSKLSVA